MGEFRRGWRLLAGAFIGVGTGASALYFYSVGLFLKPLAEAFHWGRGEATVGPLVATVGAALCALPTGLVMDRIGPVRTAIVSMMILASSFAALAMATHDLVSFCLIIGLLGAATVGTTAMSYSRLIVAHFHRSRGMALGIVLTSSGLAGALLPNLLAPFIADHGWRSGYLLLAAISASAVIPVVWLIHGADRADQPAIPRARSPSSAVFTTAHFQILWIVFCIGALGALGALVHVPALLSDLGASPSKVGAITGLVGVSAIAGRVLAGLVLDRAPARGVVAGVFLLSAAGLLLLSVYGLAHARLGAALLGLTVGAETTLLAYLTSRLFPPVEYGRAYGGVYALFLVGGALGQWLLGWIYDHAGGYAPSFNLAAACLACAGLLALFIPDGATEATAS